MGIRFDLGWNIGFQIRLGLGSRCTERAGSAGIRTIVITGDYARTSEFVLAQLGIT